MKHAVSCSAESCSMPQPHPPLHPPPFPSLPSHPEFNTQNLTVFANGHSSYIRHAPASASGSFDGGDTCAPARVAAVGVSCRRFAAISFSPVSCSSDRQLHGVKDQRIMRSSRQQTAGLSSPSPPSSPPLSPPSSLLLLSLSPLLSLCTCENEAHLSNQP